MKRLMVVLLAAAALVFLVSTGNATLTTWNYTNIISGTLMPTSSITATLEDVAGGVQLTMAISGPSTNTNFVDGDGFYFNYNPYGTLAGITLPTLPSGVGQVASGISRGSDAFRADGDGYYDLNITFASAGGPGDNGRLQAGESSSYFFAGLTTAGFNDLSAPGPGGSPGPFLSAVHVQGLEDGDSVWLSPAPVPVPGTMLLLGSGLAGLVGIGRRRMKK